MKPTRLTTWLFSGLCVFAASSCEQKEPAPDAENLVQVSYAETNCANPWGQSTSEQQLVTETTKHLAKYGVTSFQQQSILYTAAPACANCTCITGRLVIGTVRKNQLNLALALGLTKF